MHLPAGALLGVYQIVELLGTGGMGVVYRAVDTRLRRDVALKVLHGDAPSPRSRDGHAAVAVADKSIRTRLLHEARAAAALNHPHICAVYDVGEVEGTAFIAMELVAGHTLQDLLTRAPLPTARACRYGRQLADALEHAHSRGIIHRDFKSANVLVTPDAVAKVLDFGIARRLATPTTGATQTATDLAQLEEIGGTLPYMSPEVLQGSMADVRSDIWALGVVLYEMIGGTRPFQGTTRAQLTAAILRDHPPALPSHIPAALVHVVRRCLAKDPADRFARAGEVAAALESSAASIDGKASPLGSLPADNLPAATAAPRRSPRPLAAIAVSGAVVGSMAIWLAVRDRSSVAEEAVPLGEPPIALTQFATSARAPVFSPDGKLLAFVVQEPKSLTTQIFVKTMPDGRPTPLTRGPGAKEWPAFSPDGKRISYTVTGEEWRWDTWVMESTGGTPQLLLGNANSLQWLKDGRVLFSEFKRGSHLSIAISAEGREDKRDLYVPEPQGMAHFSDLSPDGAEILIGEMVATQTTQGGGIRTRCFVMPLAGGPDRAITAGVLPCLQLARWAPAAGAVYFVAGTPGNYHVWRRSSDGHTEQVTTGQTMFVRGVVPGGFALTPDGTTLVYSAGATQESLWLRRADGTETQLTFEGDARTPSVSSDGQRVFYVASARFTAGPIRVRRLDSDEERSLASGHVANTVWAAPDGDRFAFSRPDHSGVHLWLGTTDNSEAPRQLTFGDSTEVAAVFSPDGQHLFYAQIRGGDATLWSLDLDGGEPQRISDPVGRLAPVSVSPDGKWLSVLRTDVTPRETWLYATEPGVAPRRLYSSWRFDWAPGNRAFLLSNSGMISTAWSLPNPRRAILPPTLGGEPTPTSLERLGARKVLVADFFVDPTPMPEPFSIVYSHVEGRANLFQTRVPSR
jgi:serine/threonine protein kinase/Tol biopolymer transport system component